MSCFFCLCSCFHYSCLPPIQCVCRWCQCRENFVADGECQAAFLSIPPVWNLYQCDTLGLTPLSFCMIVQLVLFKILVHCVKVGFPLILKSQLCVRKVHIKLQAVASLIMRVVVLPQFRWAAVVEGRKGGKQVFQEATHCQLPIRERNTRKHRMPIVAKIYVSCVLWGVCT